MSSHTSKKWFYCRLELIRITWKGFGEEDAVVERDVQAIKSYEERD
jgi:hypothetical protein